MISQVVCGTKEELTSRARRFDCAYLRTQSCIPVQSSMIKYNTLD